MSHFRRVSLRSSALRLATALASALVALTAASSAHAAVACQSSSLAQAAGMGSCWRPFSSASPFNTELGSGPQLASDNVAVQQHIAQYGWTVGASSSGFSIGASDGTRPIYYASPSDPVMTIHCTSSEGAGTCQGANGVDVNGTQINVPAGARPFANSDAHMTIVETSTGLEYDLWQASISGSTITAGTGAQTNVDTGSGIGGGGDAANFALSAGLLKPSELVNGQIDHALVVVVPCTNATGAHVGYTWPATGGWGQFCGQYWKEQASNAPELGQLIKLNMTPGQIADSGAPRWQQTIMTALANYGAYIEDTEGSWHNEGIYILTQSSTSWTNVGQTDQWASAVSAFGQSGDNLSSNVPIPARDLEMVDTCTTQGTCPNGTGPAPSTGTTNPVAVATSARNPTKGRRGRPRPSAHSRRAASRRTILRRKLRHEARDRARRHHARHRSHRSHRSRRHHHRHAHRSARRRRHAKENSRDERHSKFNHNPVSRRDFVRPEPAIPAEST